MARGARVTERAIPAPVLVLALLVFLGFADPSPRYCGLPCGSSASQTSTAGTSTAQGDQPDFILPAANLVRTELAAVPSPSAAASPGAAAPVLERLDDSPARDHHRLPSRSPRPLRC